jgi:segregation and condensation protein B
LPFPEVTRVPRAPEPQANPEQIVEAALFVGGPPFTAEKFHSATRVPAEVFHDAVDALNRRYKSQRRPYTIHPKDGGYVLALRPQFRSLREKLFGGPREARLSQAALDVLSLVAYRQPIDKPEIDALRGYDSGHVLRQLVRLGLIAVLRRGEAGHADVSYGTTPRFLDLFHLASLDDLPRLGESEVS